MSKAPYEFDRYVDGALMAEGITIERAGTFDMALLKATKIASQMTRKRTVLVLRSPATDAENQRLRAEVAVLREACREYDLALAEGFPNGAAGNVFVRWNRARNLTRKAPQ